MAQTKHFRLVLIIALLSISVAVAPSMLVPVRPSGMPIRVLTVPGPSTPYVQMFPIQNQPADPSPWLLYPASNRTVWVVTIKVGTTTLAQLVNFTDGNAQPVANLTNAVPSDLVYDGFATNNTRRVWLLENNSLAYYNPTVKNLTIAKVFPGGDPQYMTIDPLDRFWITLLGTNQIVEYSPSNGNTTYFMAPSAKAGLEGITVDPLNGSVWFAEAYSGAIGHLIPCNTPPCPMGDYRSPPGINLQFVIQVAVDFRGVVWFTIHGGNEFGSFDPSTGKWELFPIGYCLDSYVPDCEVGLPNAMSIDAYGQVWFSEHYAGRIARYNQTLGSLVEYSMPTTSRVCSSPCTPYSWWMWPGPGNRVWFTSYGLGEIGYVNESQAVPYYVSSPANVTIRQAGSVSLPVSALYTNGSPPSFNASATSQDIFSSNSPMLSWSVSPTRVQAGSHNATSTLNLSVAWNATIGSRYIALSAYNQNVTVSEFVRVDLLQCVPSCVPTCTPHLWTCTPALGQYTTIGFAGGISAFSVSALGLSWYSKKKRNSQTVHSDPSELQPS